MKVKMSQSPHLFIAARHAQMFPRLELAEIDRSRRFGEAKSYASSEHVLKAGEVAPGLIVILSGKVQVTQGRGLDLQETIVTHGPGHFVGELAQLSGRPSLVDAEALEPVEAIVVPSDRLRDLIVQEAELGERIMRALILRRVGLLESGASGPVIIGQAEHADVLRLQGFLARNGQPHRVLDSDSDSCAKTLIERFHVDVHHYPSCFVQMANCCAIPMRTSSPAALAWFGGSMRRRSMTWQSSALGRRDWLLPCMRHRRGFP